MQAIELNRADGALKELQTNLVIDRDFSLVTCPVIANELFVCLCRLQEMVAWTPKATLLVVALAFFSTAVRSQESELFQCPEGNSFNPIHHCDIRFLLFIEIDPS